MAKDGVELDRGRWPELVLAVLAGVVFLGCLGSVDLWGKREQRASAEAIDTIVQHHWLIAEIQGRPRLEKPPLPRWTIATLMSLTGRRDEWMVRLPGALSALGMVGLVYLLGRRIAGRPEALAGGLVLSSVVFFIAEQRQAGNDGPLAFFTTLALYCAWRRLHGDDGQPLGRRGWSLGFHAALGLGFLSKGPIILIIAAVALVPYLAIERRLREGLRALLDWRGLLLFLLLALCWPVPVLIDDPNAARVWYLEMAQKTGAVGFKHHHHREFLLLNWPGMTAPWTVLATIAVSTPLTGAFRRWRGRPGAEPVAGPTWFLWSWAVGNLLMFCLWTVAKPNYYLPCLPAVALLTGIETIRLTRLARDAGRAATRARRLIQGHWVVLFTGALALPVVVHQVEPGLLGWSVVAALALAAGVVASAWAWRRGADAIALTPLVGALAVVVVVAYGALGPRLNPQRSHRALAETLDRVLPDDTRTVMFYRELDEGLWFYLRDRSLAPVPNSQPKYNKGLDLYDDFKSNQLIWDDDARFRNEGRVLIDWLRQAERPSDYVLVRAKVYNEMARPEFFGRELAELVTPIYTERDLKRNELILLRARPTGRVAADDRARR